MTWSDVKWAKSELLEQMQRELEGPEGDAYLGKQTAALVWKMRKYIEATIEPAEVVRLLNKYLAYSPDAVSNVFASRYPVSGAEAREAIVADPTLIAGGEGNALTLGPLGILNGLFGTKLVAHYGTNGIIHHFCESSDLCEWLWVDGPPSTFIRKAQVG